MVRDYSLNGTQGPQINFPQCISANILTSLVIIYEAISKVCEHICLYKASTHIDTPARTQSHLRTLVKKDRTGLQIALSLFPFA